MPTKGSCQKLITSGFSIRKVKRMTFVTPCMDEFPLFRYYTCAGLHQIRYSNYSSACQPGKHYRPFLRGARRLNKWYSILMLKNSRWRFQQCTLIFIIGLSVWTGSSVLATNEYDANCTIRYYHSISTISVSLAPGAPELTSRQRLYSLYLRNLTNLKA
jgi:hypothetical protein